MTYFYIFTSSHIYNTKQQMSSFRDMINSKLSNSKSKQDVQTSKTYDESWLKITAVGGQTQLCPIKLNCVWANPAVVSRPPALSCKWFSKTDISLAQIQGISGTYYQPTLNDVGSKIQIQCIPELQGIQYEGMPISIQVGPIKIDPETEEEASDFLQANKATFFIKLIRLQGEQTKILNGQGLIKINQNNLRVVSRPNNKTQKQLLQIQMEDACPELICYPKSPKELTLSFPQQKQKLILQFTNNKIRDVFILLIKLIQARLHSAGTGKESENFASDNVSTMEEKKQEPQVNKTESQQMQKQKKSERSNIQSPETSLQNLQRKKINSSDDLKNKNSPKNDDLTVPSTSNIQTKQNTQQLLQSSELLKQIRVLEKQNYAMKKQLAERDDRIYQLTQKLNMIEQRSKNLNSNYFQLQNELKKCKNSEESTNEQISYFRNESRLVKKENEKLTQKIKEYVAQINDLDAKLEPYLKDESISYEELRNNYELECKIRNQTEIKSQYLIEERKQMEEKWQELQESYQSLQAQKNYYVKKYENLSAELPHIQLQPQIITIVPQKPKQEQSQQTSTLIKRMQEEILGLKLQIKQAVEENEFLRSINVSAKDKKSSKTQLKLQLLETKKIINRLTETVTQKDEAIFHLKSINRGISEQLEDLRKQLKPGSL